MEDYKKKYEEALERAKFLKESTDGVGAIDISRRFEEIFPELKESEDEKMRNFISNELACLRATDEKGSDRYEELTNALAWLEAQGKNEEINEASYRVGIKRVLDNPESYGLEKQGEQKPAWSEKDEDLLNDIEESLLAYKIIIMDNDTELANYIEKEINFLKSLKDRYIWKPSDEQMEAIRLAAEIGTANNSWAMGILKSMYHDLKKTKGGIVMKANKVTKSGIELIAEERQRQIEVEGYNAQHDSQHKASDLVYAGIAYAESAKVGINCVEIGNTNETEIMLRKIEMGKNYPFGWDFKPSTDVRDLVKAGAFYAAAIDRLQME